MKTHYLVGFAALALAFAGCSKNEILETEGSKTGNAISFSTYAKGSKGTAIDNTSFATSGHDFGVTAFLSTTGQDVPYMGALDKGASITHNGTVWNYADPADARYWPKDVTTLVFYGYTPFANTNRGGTLAFDKAGGMVFDNYVVPTTVANQEDFMWAYTSTNKATSSAGVLMTFHHALVRVNFKARVTTSTLKVDIAKDGITICNIKKKGKVTITSATTVADWTTPKDADGTPLNDITVPSDIASITYNTTTPTAATDVSSTTAGDAVMLMPQTFAAWNPKGGTAATASGLGYLKVMCKIYNTSTTTAIYYHGTLADYAAIYIPLSSTDNAATDPKPIWVANNNITYTLNFGGGYADDGNPILTPIKFTTAVTNWTDATDPDLPM
ncbi:MAG: fimbrillin family protein [Mucinivorans sp.]